MLFVFAIGISDKLFQSVFFNIHIVFRQVENQVTDDGRIKPGEQETGELVESRLSFWKTIPEMQHDIIEGFVENHLKLPVPFIVSEDAPYRVFQFTIKMGILVFRRVAQQVVDLANLVEMVLEQVNVFGTDKSLPLQRTAMLVCQRLV